MKRVAYEFRRDIVIGAENLRTGGTMAEKVLARWKRNTECEWCDGSHTSSDCPSLECDRWQQDGFGSDSEPESDAEAFGARKFPGEKIVGCGASG